MATIKKAQFGRLVKQGLKAADKVTIPTGLKKSIAKSQSKPTKLKSVGSSEAERIAFGKKTNLQENPYSNPDYDKSTFIDRDIKKSKPKTDKYGFDIRPDRNGGTHKKAQEGKMVTNSREVNPWEKDTTGLSKATKELTQISKKRIPIGKSIKSSNYKPSMTKYKNGGSLSAIKKTPTKRVGPVDPKGAFTKVQKKTLAGAKGKASLTKNKQLGATKMAKSGAKISKKK